MKKTFKFIRRYIVIILAGILAIVSILYNRMPKVGEPVDSFNGVTVYYNGVTNRDIGRNITEDGYNLGLQYQCVEYIKRYYYERFGHKMPETYGHAKDFFDPAVPDGAVNSARNLKQYANPSPTKPQIDDIIVLKGLYGHVTIVTNVKDNSLEVIQQNTQKSRRSYKLENRDGLWEIKSSRVMGWLRLKNEQE